VPVEGVPDDLFMILAFDREAISAKGGVVRYRDEFNEAI